MTVFNSEVISSIIFKSEKETISFVLISSFAFKYFSRTGIINRFGFLIMKPIFYYFQNQFISNPFPTRLLLIMVSDSYSADGFLFKNKSKQVGISPL